MTEERTEERTEVYLFWNKERPTGSREILFSGATHTASLYWDSKRSHFATTDRLATGMYSGMLLGDDFGPLRAESFQVTSSATFLTIQLRSEVSPATPRPPAPLPKEPPTPDSPGDTLCPPDTPGDTLCPPDTPGDTLYPSDTSGEERRPADYYDHLIGENPYKIPRDILPDRIYQVPSSIPIAQSLATTVKTPLFIPRLKPRNLATHATISVKNSAPHDPCPPSPSQVPVAAPRPPRKVRDGLDIQIRIPSHYDTCSRVSTVLLKQASESGTRATQSGPLPSVLRDAGPPPRTPPPAETPTSPLTTQRRFMLKRPPIASALHRDASGSKASLSSLPVPASRLSTSPLAFVRSPPDISHFPPKLLSMTSDVFEESADYVTLCPLPEETKGGQESSRLLAELHQLREQLSSLRSELKREVSERERLEQEVSSGSKECEHLKTLCANATEERAADQKLLAEERANSGKLKSQILILTNHKIQEKGPKLLKPKPILPKPTKKV